MGSMVNVNHLTVHLGPPKTGSTSIQNALGSIEHSGSAFRYLGVMNPRISYEDLVRSIEKHPIEAMHVRAAYPEDFPTSESMEVVANALKSFVGENLFGSEEMFLVDLPRKVTWQKKIARLRTLTSGLNIVPLVIIRSPVDATFSMFNELRKTKSLRIPNFYQRLASLQFCFSNQANVYHYRYLFSVLKQSGFESVRILNFTEVFSGKFMINRFIGKNGGRVIEFPQDNSTVKSKIYRENFEWFSSVWSHWIFRGCLGERQRFFDSLVEKVSRKENPDFKLDELLHWGL
jgi:hypothetical protein